MINLSTKKTMPCVLDAKERGKNFCEVVGTYTDEQAITEAQRCLNCKNSPCVGGCPVGINIPKFIQEVANGEFEKAYDTITESSSLPAVCGRVCPQETQCEGVCMRAKKAGVEPVAIGRLERFVADRHVEKQSFTVEKNGHKVAVIGSGPASLACAGELIKKGYGVTVYEALGVFGGVLVYGIPEFRLPKDIVKKEIQGLEKQGVEFVKDVVIGKTLTIEELKTEFGYEAVFIGTGAGLPKFMGIDGENLKGVFSANEFLTRNNLMKAYLQNSDTPIWQGKSVVVVGGGNVAMDAARTALRLGANVKIVYRRGEEELPARKEEIEHAKEEGVEFVLLTNPVKIMPTAVEDKKDENYGKVAKIECVKMELGEPDASGRRSPVVVENSEFTIDCDTVIMALGTSPNPLIARTTDGLEIKKRGEIMADEKGQTSLEGVFSGGDATTGAATVIKAMGAGKVSANAIDEYIRLKEGK